MSLFDFIIITGLVSIFLYVMAIVIAPPLSYFALGFSRSLDETIAEHHFVWMNRAARAAANAYERRSRRQFIDWLASPAGVAGPDETVNRDLIEAQRLTPLIRVLLQEEIPAAVKHCNGLHFKMAVLSGAVHMREIAAEPECLIMRCDIANLLHESDAFLQQYPLHLRLEADDLLHASIAIRKSLLPICSRCPYIRQPVCDAGERCPAAQLIHIEVRQ